MNTTANDEELGFEAADIDYFEVLGDTENPRFWSRFDSPPDLDGLTVGDVGCGHGRMCVDMARAGAGRVIGFDLEARLIDFANGYVPDRYPELSGRIEFRHQDLGDASDLQGCFDLLVSKDSFEHVIDLPSVLAAMQAGLKPGGQAFIGFGPLWNSPYGDHRLTGMKVPWGHVMATRSFLIKRVNRRRDPEAEAISSIQDLGLNGYSLADYRRIVAESGFEVVFFEVNRSARLLSRIFALGSRLPGMAEYFSHNIYCVLKKPS